MSKNIILKHATPFFARQGFRDARKQMRADVMIIDLEKPVGSEHLSQMLSAAHREIEHRRSKRGD